MPVVDDGRTAIRESCRKILVRYSPVSSPTLDCNHPEVVRYRTRLMDFLSRCGPISLQRHPNHPTRQAYAVFLEQSGFLHSPEALGARQVHQCRKQLHPPARVRRANAHCADRGTATIGGSPVPQSKTSGSFSFGPLEIQGLGSRSLKTPSIAPRQTPRIHPRDVQGLGPPLSGQHRLPFGGLPLEFSRQP